MDQSIVDSFSSPQCDPQTRSRQPQPARPAAPAPAAKTVEYMAAYLPRRPWLRFLARCFDLLLFSVVAEALLAYCWPQLPAHRFWLAGLIPGILLYLLVDAFLMAAFGKTPGKQLLKIHVVTGTWGRMTFRQAIRRSFAVGWHGLAFGLPGISFLTLGRSRKRLLEKGKTQWDAAGQLYVMHEEAGVTGPMLLVGASFVLLLAGFIMAYLIGGRSTEALPEVRMTGAIQQDSTAANSQPDRISGTAASPNPGRVLPPAAGPASHAALPSSAAPVQKPLTARQATGNHGHRLPHRHTLRPLPGGIARMGEASEIAAKVWANLRAPAVSVHVTHRRHAAKPLGRHRVRPAAGAHVHTGLQGSSIPTVTGAGAAARRRHDSVHAPASGHHQGIHQQPQAEMDVAGPHNHFASQGPLPGAPAGGQDRRVATAEAGSVAAGEAAVDGNLSSVTSPSDQTRTSSIGPGAGGAAQPVEANPGFGQPGALATPPAQAVQMDTTPPVAAGSAQIPSLANGSEGAPDLPQEASHQATAPAADMPLPARRPGQPALLEDGDQAANPAGAQVAGRSGQLAPVVPLQAAIGDAPTVAVSATGGDVSRVPAQQARDESDMPGSLNRAAPATGFEQLLSRQAKAVVDETGN